VIEVFALLFGIALPVSVVYVVFKRGKHELDAAVAYRQVARNLGLDVDTRGVSLQGHLGERRLWVGEVLVGYGPDRSTAIWGVLDMTRPLTLGLHVRRRGLSERVFRRGRGQGVELGDASFDRLVEMHGDDPARVRALMGDPDVKQAITELLGSWSDVIVTDHAVRVHLKRAENTERGLQRLVDMMLRTASALERARAAVAVPKRLETASKEWGDLAERLSLVHEPWLPAMAGERSGRQVVVTAWRADSGYFADLRLYFRSHRQMGFRLRPQVEPDGYWSVGQDIQIGDAAFDSQFVLKGWDPRRIRDLLTPSVRAVLLEAQESGHLQIDDKRIHIRDLPLDVESIERAMQHAEAAADALGW
jgi:hypothetical protein